MHRYVNEGDPIPSVPSPTMGFKHIADGLDSRTGSFLLILVDVPTA